MERDLPYQSAFWGAWALGWRRIRLYDPGWYEWSRDPANPIATGPLQKDADAPR
jgi:molybdopterin synthase sulfurtransferase